MTTITVEPTESSLLISEAGTNDAAERFTALPPLTAARYLVVASDAVDRLRQSETPLLDSIRPHAHSTFVALEAGFGTAVDEEKQPPAMRLAAELGVTVVAPEGQFLSCDGALFAVGADNGWVAYSPLGVKFVHGRRYPAPSWQEHLPVKVKGTVQIPAGLWVTAEADPSHAVHLADIAVHPQKLLVVVGSPDAPAPEFTQLLDALRALPDQTRASALLVGYGEESLGHDTVRRLAEELQEPLRIAHGVTIGGELVRLDRARETLTATFAKESVCTPDGVIELDRWSAPLGLANVSRNSYRLAPGWLADVVPAGLVVRPARQAPVDAVDALAVMPETLTVTLCADGAEDLKRVVEPLRTMLERLREHTRTRLIPGDRTARRVIRNAFPGTWAPTARLAVTEDGRIIAASVDDDEIILLEEQVPQAPRDADDVGPQIGDDQDGADGLPAPAPPSSRVDTGTASEDAEDSGRELVPGRQPDAADLAPTVLWNREAGASAPAADGVASRSAPIPHARVEPPAPSALALTHEAGRPSAGAEEMPARSHTAPPPAAAAEEDDDALVEPTGSQKTAAMAAPQPAPRLVTKPSDPSDALARALRGSAASADLLAGGSSRPAGFDAADAITGAAGRGISELSLRLGDVAPRTRGTASSWRPESPRAEEAAASDVGGASASGSDASASEPGGAEAGKTGADAAAESESGEIATADARAAEESSSAASVDPPDTMVSAPMDDVAPTEIEVPRDARSTAAQRQRVRAALGARYDVASRSVSQLLAQQPGMRVTSGDRAALLTALSVVSVFAHDPTARYDLDFHTCLAEGLAALPTTRSIVVRGLPAAPAAPQDAMVCSSTPFLSAPVDAPLTGPVEALIWTTSGRRLDRLMAGTDAAADVIVPAHTRLRVLGTADGRVPRLLLAEAGVNEEGVLTRLHDAAARRDSAPMAAGDSRWLGELREAV
ncbi:hypothetical protein ACFWHT_10770 [Microbacterium sp. NPDC058342]|uniref:hypothetical protein n=1 Tax=Microbacterium sp. NPDC058342 TaxID=3346454 RepID=UPI00364DFCF5